MPVFPSFPFPRSICPRPPLPSSLHPLPGALFQEPVVPSLSSIRSWCIPTVSFKQCCFFNLPFFSPFLFLDSIPPEAMDPRLSYCRLRTVSSSFSGLCRPNGDRNDVIDVLCVVKFSTRTAVLLCTLLQNFPGGKIPGGHLVCVNNETHCRTISKNKGFSSDRLTVCQIYSGV